MDTDFYVYNPVPSAYVARLIITALQDGITVNIDDTTDDSDDVSGISLNKGTFHSEPLSGESILHVTSNKPIYMYFGYLDDNNWEIMTSISGELVGKEYYVPTPCYVGVMPQSDGNLEITRVKDSATVYSGSTTKGNAIITKTNAGPCSGKASSGWDGANMVYINSTQPVYAWIMDWISYDSDSSFIPAVLGSNNQEFYGYASDDGNMDARVWVFAFEDSDTTTGTINKGEHLIAGNPFDNDNFKVVSNKPVTVKIEGYHTTGENGNLVIGLPKPPRMLTLKTDKEKYKLGDTVYLNIVINRTGQYPIYAKFKLKLDDPDGTPDLIINTSGFKMNPRFYVNKTIPYKIPESMWIVSGGYGFIGELIDANTGTILASDAVYFTIDDTMPSSLAVQDNINIE